MSVKPIDLQTLFMHMSRVGKEQAAHKNAEIMSQEVRGREMAQKAEQSDHRVNQAKDADEGPEKVKEDEEHSRRGNYQEEHAQQDQEEKTEKKNKFFRDPDLGNKIDITG